MAPTLGPSLTLTSPSPLPNTFVARTASAGLSSSSCGVSSAAFRAVEMQGVFSMPMLVRKSPQLVAMTPAESSRKGEKGRTRQIVVADVWSGRIGPGTFSRISGPIRAMAEDTMWITATSAVALVVSLAAFAALGGYLLSMGVDNEARGEEEKIEKLKEQGLYDKPELTQYEDQGVRTRIRKRRISED